MIYKVRLLPEAEDDLVNLYSYIARKSSHTVAMRYVDRIRAHLKGFDHSPERETIRNELKPDLRVVGFERRVSIAFKVEGNEVVMVGILYAVRQLSRDE